MQRAIVRVVEGESTVPAECTPLGICDVELPPFLPKGSPVELTYEYNANQVLEVAVDACGNQRNGLDRTQHRPGAEAELDRATASLGAIERRRKMLRRWSAFRFRFRTIRKSGTAGADIIRQSLRAALSRSAEPIRATS